MTVLLLVLGCISGCGGTGGDSSAEAKTSASDRKHADDAIDAALASVRSDAQRIAVRLEKDFATGSYPRDLAGMTRAADRLHLAPSAGNTLGGYHFDRGAREFRLCVENPTGAFAVYDTAPMKVGESARAGGCPLM